MATGAANGTMYEYSVLDFVLPTVTFLQRSEAVWRGTGASGKLVKPQGKVQSGAGKHTEGFG